MASQFLKNRANASRVKYGNQADLPAKSVAAPSARSSSFLQGMAEKSKKKIDTEYGASAYGGSKFDFAGASPSGGSPVASNQVDAAKNRKDYLEMVEKGRNYKETGFHFSIPDNGIVDSLMGGISAKSALTYLTDPSFSESERQRETIGIMPENRFSKLDYLTDDEKNEIYYHAGREEWSDINRYLDDLDADLNKRFQAKLTQQNVEGATKHPVLGTTMNILSSLFAPVSYLDAAGQSIKNAVTGEKKPLDTNTPLYQYANAQRDTQEALTEKARASAGGDGFGADLAEFAAGTGLSIGQNIARIPMGAVGGLLDMAAGAAAGQSIDVTERGASSGKAMLESTAVGVVEYLTEKLPFERLFKLAKNSPVGTAEIVRSVMKQIGMEGGEEVISEIADNIIDQAIMGDSSSYEQYVQTLKQSGLSDADARKEATMQFYVKNVGSAFAGGAVSGGVMGGGAIGLNKAGTYQTGKQFNSMDLGAEDIQTFIDEGLSSEPSSQAYKLAVSAQQKIAAGGTLSNYELGNLYHANANAIGTEEDGASILTRAAQDMADGKPVSNRTASSILENPSAVKTLEQDAGLSITDDMSKSQRRAAVKSAVETLASPHGDVADHTSEFTQATGNVAQVAQNKAAAPARPVAQQAYDIGRVQRAASSLGENGEKALTAAYNGDGDADSFYAGFASYYEAGVSGMDMGKVQSEYGGQLNIAQRYAAYVAGQNDAAASLEAEKAGVPSATVYGKEAGFIQSENSAHLPADTVRYYHSIAKAAGVKIQMAAATGANGANGWYNGGIIYIAEDAENPGTVVATHEITHRMQEMAPAEYRSYRDYAMNALAARDGSSVDVVEQYKARYAENGINLSTEQAMDEIAADFTEALTLDSTKFERLARENRSVARKLLDAVVDFIRKVKSVFKGNTGAQNRAAAEAYGVDMKTLEEASRLWEGALEATRAAVKAAESYATEDGQRTELSDKNTRFSIREKDPPTETGIAYKVFYAKDGQLYPPMVANPNGAGTPVGVWLDADIGQSAPPSKTGRAQVQGGGKGTNAGKMSLAFRPGWHMGDIPLARQFGRLNQETGAKDLFPSDFVWAECEYAKDMDYQEEAMSYGYTESGKFRHAYAGLPKVPTDGYYRYRTNPNPDTVPWVISGAMKVNKILTDKETDAICRKNGAEPMARQGGTLNLEKLGLGATTALKDGKTAAWSDKRIDRLYDAYASSSPNYAKAYAAFISPDDFLSLTTSNRGQIEAQSRPLDTKELEDERQEIQLTYDPETPGQVFGHEGRHRMVALKNAGVERVAIAVQFLGETGKYDRKPIKSLPLRGEDFGRTQAPGNVTLEDLVPISRAYRAEIEEKFGSGAKAEVRFSLKAPVEETRDLLALHNLTEKNLLDALEIGGMPMPSIAVVPAKQGHERYGEISLVFSKDTIDPQRNSKNKVYGGDAYTPTAPAIDRTVNRDIARRASNKIYDLSLKIADGMFTGEASSALYFNDDYTSDTMYDILDEMSRNNGVKAAYLADNGKTLTPVMSENVKKYDSFGNDALSALVEHVGAQELSAMYERATSENGLTAEDKNAVRAEIRSALENREDGLGVTPEQISRKVESRLEKLTEERMAGFIRNAWKIHEDGAPSVTQEIDRYATIDALDDAAPEDAVREWVRPQIDGLLGEAGVYNGKERYTQSGNRKSFAALHNAYTLENIVKAMDAQQKSRGEATWGVTAKTLQSVATPSYKSVKDIKADSGRLGTADDAAYEAQTNAIDAKITEIIYQVKSGNKAHSDNPFTESDIIAEAMMEAARGTKTVDAIIRSFSKDDYKISSQTAQDIQSVFKSARELPTEYFEAKPRRAVGFDEVLAAVVPSNASSELRGALDKADVRTLEYKTGDDADRLKKVNSVDGARFSLKADSEGKSLTVGQREYFNDSKVVDSSGQLRVMYSGGSDDFTVFDRKKSSYANLYGRGFYFTDSESHAKQYGNPRAYYLNIVNPVSTSKTTITRAQMRKFIQEVASNEDDFSFENYGYDATVDSVLKSVYGKSDFAMLCDVSQTAIGDMVSAVELFNEVNGSDFDGLILDTETVTFRSEQAKNVDNENPTDDPDIRRSLKGSGNIQRDIAALQEETSLLKDRVDYWRGQTRRTTRVTTDKKSVARAARELIRSYGADIETADILGELQGLYDYIASGTDGENELTYQDARRRAELIARSLVENALAVDDDGYQQYSDLRSYLRSTKLTISETDSHDIADYGDFRKHNFGRMILAGGKTNIDQVYQEMASKWPEFFDEQRETHPADQLARISEVMDGIYDLTEYNPFSHYMDQAVTGATNEIMEKFFDLPQTRATFADRQARKLDDAKANGKRQVQEARAQKDAKIEELRAQNRKRVRESIQKERVRRGKQIDKLKSRYKEKDAAGRERRSARELRAKIIRHAKVLSQKLLRPSDKQHIPESLRQATSAALEAINLESAFSVDPETGKWVRDGSGTPTKRTDAFRALRLSYADITKDGGDYTLIIDPDLMDNLNDLEGMKNTPLAEMGTEQLATVWATLKAVEASIRTANKMLGASRFETISQFADGIKDDNALRKDRGNYKGILGKMDKLVSLDMMTPQAYFHRMGDTGEELFHMMRTAQDRHIVIMEETRRATEKIVGKVDIRKLEREVHTFDVGNGKLTMSTAQIMALYELLKRKQAEDHIFKGGIRPDSIDGGHSILESRRSDPVRPTIGDISAITGVLTEEQIKIADELQRYMGNELAEIGNEASMEVYGYRKFNEPDYFPIQVDKNQTKKDIAKEAQAATIAGRGFTKSVAPKANNAIMINSIFDVYSAHVTDMATYAAWLPTMENVRRIRDFTFRDGEGARIGDVKTVIERVFGKNGNAYLNKLVDDINQGLRPNGTGNLTDSLVGNYKAAAVAANIRVILQQPTAILRALDALDPKYLLQGAVKRGDWEKVMKYAPIARWKDWGYFDINTGRQMKDVLLNCDTPLEKLRQAGMSMAGKADSFAWARLWNAVEAEMKDKRPGLVPGTDPFYKAVSARFSELIDRTQVVDGLLQRSQIMRSPDALTKMSTSFMAEPTKTYNMFLSAVYDVRRSNGKEARSEAKKALARTTAALVTSFAVNAIAQSLVDALRDDDKEKDYWEKLFTAYTGFSGDEETFLDYWNSFWSGNLEANVNPLSYLPYLKDLLSIAQGYDVTRMDMEAVEKVWTAATNMKKATAGEGKYTLAGASANLVAEAARLLGLPVANLKRDIQAAATTAAIETDSYLMQYRIDRALLNMGYGGNTRNFMDTLYNASINDQDAYETIYADMVKRGIGEDKIRNAMESRMKNAQGVESVEELEVRYLTPSQERTYTSIHRNVSKTSIWDSASTKQRDSLDADLFNITVENDAGKKLQEKIDGGSPYGISETDYLLYRLAQDVSSEDGNSSTSQVEAEAAIALLEDMTDDAKAYLWQSTNKGWKPEGNPYG